MLSWRSKLVDNQAHIQSMKHLLILLFLLPALLFSQADPKQEAWVDSVFQTLTLKEKIGQLMMIRAHSNLGPDHIAKVKQQVKDYAIGGLCFFQGTPEKQAELTNDYERIARLPLMIAMDAEWGLGMRLKENSISFPYQLTLGAMQDNRLLYDMGLEVARQMRRLGVHVNFAPVADVNNNPNNPVIGFRSFGEDRFQVASKAYLYTKGMQDGGVMACAKHFPGHGDTDLDSHYDLPVISHPQKHLDSLELTPFRILIEQGIQSVMVAHLHVPAIDDTENMPTTLSPKAVTDLLRKKMGFDGLIITDGLGMKGVTKHFPPGEVEARALAAGNDLLLLPENVEAAFTSILQFLKEGKIDQKEFEESVKRILRSKYALGLTKTQRVNLTNLRTDLNSAKAKSLKRKLVAQSLTLVRNKNEQVPFGNLAGKKIASLSLGANGLTDFQKRLSSYKTMKHFQAKKDLDSAKRALLINQLKEHDLVIVGLHDMSNSAKKNFGLSDSDRALLTSLNTRAEVVLVVFGNPYSLRYLDAFETILMAYQESEDTQDLAAQALFGVNPINGKLPVTASPRSKYLDGESRPATNRLGYAAPEDVGMRSEILNQIDGLANEAVAMKATPGAVVMVVKEGKIVFEKAYGYHTYAKKRKTQSTDIFDLASITKILAGTMSIIKLQETGVVDIYDPLKRALPQTRTTNKAELTLQDIMAHRARLKSWIKFYEQTIDSKATPSTKFYQRRKNPPFTVPVTERLFLTSAFKDSIQQQIFRSELREKMGYKYSDLGFYLVADIVKQQSGQRLDQFASENIYQPMGLEKITFNPWQKYSLSQILPTEVDKYFRRQTVWGYVHDMGAAMLGGVSGHAGLFSDAHDVAALMQMVLNGGKYGGQQILDSETLRIFTSRHPECTRRGIGFDMKELDANKSQNVDASCSSKTFGHLGFTGTCVWADPEHDLIYVFLSNRTYPSMNNYKLNKEDFRPRIQHIIYQALEKKPI